MGEKTVRVDPARGRLCLGSLFYILVVACEEVITIVPDAPDNPASRDWENLSVKPYKFVLLKPDTKAATRIKRAR